MSQTVPSYDVASLPVSGEFRAADIERVFALAFADERCLLAGGAAEPLYTPRSHADEPDVIYYTRDYFASALHEVAHWCLAGEQRRRQVDYGYWYAPDGRDEAQQRAFEQVEVKPQALEWLFNLCTGHRFRISADNLGSALGPSPDFAKAVKGQARRYISALYDETELLPSRGRRFALALCDVYQRPLPVEADVDVKL